MIRDYLKTAARNMIKHKGFSVIDIAGLTLGLVSCILIGLFVWDEYQYDRFIPDGDRVYRVYSEHLDAGGNENFSVTPPMFATTLQKDFPEVDKTARVLMSPDFKILFEYGKTKLYEQGGLLVDSSFLEVFPLPFKYGTALKALDDPSSLLISQEIAERYFGNSNPVGRQMLLNKTPVLIKGVFEKNPKFHLQFDFLRPISSARDYIPAERMQSWGWQQFFTYVKLKKGTDPKTLQSGFQKTFMEKASVSLKRKDLSQLIFFQPLKNIHLYSADFKFDIAERGNITYVRALTMVAIFILAIACFNFVNLATAKSLQRAREVGVRKAIGATKKELFTQFTGETIFLTMISIILSAGITALALPSLNAFTGKHISATIFINPILISSLIFLAVVVGLLAGFYPALVMSSFKPVNVLKGSVTAEKSSGKSSWMRQGVVVLQFTLSALLIISAMIVFHQVDYLHNKDLGFNKDQILFFPMRGDEMFRKQEAFKSELLRTPGVNAVSIGYGFPGDAVAGDEIIVNQNGQHVSFPATQLAIDYDYIKTLGLQIVAGRDFSKAMGTDADHAWIINETAIRELGFGNPQKALGQILYWHPWDGNNKDSLKIGQVIGVVKDFNYKSLYDKVESAVLQIYPQAAWKVAVKINTSNTGNTITNIKKVWDHFTPDYPIEYQFLDAKFERMYHSEDKLKILLSVFTSIAVFIGCLGLFGLAIHSAEQRRKEVGIRKVLGAGNWGIVLLLSRDFIKLVILSLVIASPFAWHFMNHWLQDFAYRVTISGWEFLLAAAGTISIAILTVGYQAIKAARTNPIASVRSQ
jgi:putative ABC transport system permease protein